MKFRLSGCVWLLLAVAVSTAHAHSRVSESEVIQKTFLVTPQGGQVRVAVDNIFGYIKVVGHGGDQVELTAHRRFDGKHERGLERAKQEVRLDLRQDGNEVVIYVDGPFRNQQNQRSWWDDYTATFNFELRVPVESDIDLRTVNDGHIEVDGVEGDFSIKNVNGKIEMRGAAGSGVARTVNGPVRLWFVDNPKAEIEVETVNGDVELHLQRGLRADLYLKTFNGDFWTAFEVEPAVSSYEPAERKAGRWTHKSRSWTHVRAGGGGPEFHLRTLNGDVLLRDEGR